MAAQCKDCGLKASCSCQLVKGRCSACNYKFVQSQKQGNVTIQAK